MKFLAIYEAPCVGTVAETFEADSIFEAEGIAWDRSFEVYEYVDGGVDLYLISYNQKTHRHELTLSFDLMKGDREK